MGERVVQAVHGRRSILPDPAFEKDLSAFLKERYGQEGLIELLSRHQLGEGAYDDLLRRAIWRALARSFGDGVRIAGNVGCKHPETFEIGSGVFLGTGVFLQGRFDGTCRIGDQSWIGPHAYFDARDLIIENNVGWGPGAKVLGSMHTGVPANVPIIETDLVIRPVRIEAWADIGTNAVVMPGVTVGRGAIVGAGAVVTTDVAPFSIVAGVPARFVRWREGLEQEET
jgi:galactoside O-acetyltransferase